MQFLYRSYYFYYNYNGDNLGFWFYLYWIYTCVIVGFITLMLVMVVYYHSLLAMSNATTIEDRKGFKLCFGITDTLLLAKERKFNVILFEFYCN